MSKHAEVLNRILSGVSDANVAFADLQHLLIRIGFTERIRGGHHIFTKDGVDEIINLQPKGSKAKAYQVKQVRSVILKYKLGGMHLA